MPTQLQELDVFRLIKPIVGNSESFPGRTYPLPAGTQGTVLLNHGNRYECEFVIIPPYKGWKGIEYMDTVQVVLDESQIEAVH